MQVTFTRQSVADAKTYARKIQERRASEKVPALVDNPETLDYEAQKSI